MAIKNSDFKSEGINCLKLELKKEDPREVEMGID